MIRQLRFPQFITFIVTALVALAARAGDVFVVSALEASIYRSPAESAKTASTVKRGRRIESAGPEENGFVPTLTRSGAKAWIKLADLTAEVVTRDEENLEPAEPRKPRASSREGARRGPLGLERLTFDLGASFGAVGEVSYTEIELGFNAYFYHWLAWRNAVFGRFPSVGSSIYGLDSSVRLVLDLSGSLGGITAFAGPGARFASGGGHATVPLVEGGAVFKIVGFAIGGGVKTLMNSMVQAGAPNDTQYFLILAGGGSL